jgi:hypothetical protein
MGRTAVDYNPEDRFGEGVLLGQFMHDFRWGRTTVEQCPWAHGLMPNPAKGCTALKEVFEDHVYHGQTKPYSMTAALLGAHTLGSARLETSGFNGTWSDSKNQGIFNNDYYYSIFTKGWAPEVGVGGVEGKNQWRRIDDGADPEHKEMMLDTDMCLAYKTNMELSICKRKFGNCAGCSNAFEDAKMDDLISTRGECCAWTDDLQLFRFGVLMKGRDNAFCGRTVNDKRQIKGERRVCCRQEDRKRSFGDCADIRRPRGPAFFDMMMMARSNKKFYNDFRRAWQVATNNGFTDLQQLVEGGGEIEKFEWLPEEKVREDNLIEYV